MSILAVPILLIGPLFLLAAAVVDLAGHGPLGWLAAALLVLAVVLLTGLAWRRAARWWAGTKAPVRSGPGRGSVR